MSARGTTSFFYGPGRRQVWWWDKGGGTFTERISYDEAGNLSGHEAWYEGSWHNIERRSGSNGIIVDGQWHHLRLETNGAWSLEGVGRTESHPADAHEINSASASQQEAQILRFPK